MRLIALLVVLSAVFLARAGAALADEPADAPRDVTFGAEIEFPPDTAFLFWPSCWQCDGTYGTLYRAYRIGYGAVQTELLFDKGFMGILAASDGGRIVASICRGDCNLLLPRPTDINTTELWSSGDGAVTWDLVATLQNAVAIEGFLGNDIVFKDSTDGYQARALSDGRLLTPEEESRIVGGSAPIARLCGQADTPSTACVRGLSFQRYSRLVSEVAEGQIVGNFERPSTTRPRLLSFLPGLLDVATAVVHPIGAPFGVMPLDRAAHIIGVSRGPFWRVAGPECLPLRAWADAFASVTVCAAPGVLLRPTGGVRYERGVEWREASMPNGAAGWVPRASVEG